MPRCLIGLGSNLGDRASQLIAAQDHLQKHLDIHLEFRSRVIATAPVGGPPGQKDFLNAAATLDTSLSALGLLEYMQHIEHNMGRTRDVHWGPRPIDLDLLLYGDQVIDIPQLKVPHPLMHTRRFVLEPAAQIAPQWMHSALGKTLAQLLADLD